MRVKEIWALVPVPSHVVKKVYSSVTLSKITILYFFFALLHMFVLGGFQIASHLTNYNANGVLEAIRSKAYVKGRIFPIIGPNEDGTGDTLRICDDIPQSNTDNTCVPIVDAPSNNQRPKPKQDQGAATTQDVFEALSDALYAPKTGEIRVLATLPANIASTVTTSGAADTTNVANRPVVPGTTAVRPSQVPSPASSANAVSPTPSGPVSAPAPVSAPSPAPSPSPAPTPAPAPSPAPVSAPGRGAPTRAVTLSAPAPSSPAQAPSQAPPPPPADSSEPPVFVFSVARVNRLPISIVLPIPALTRLNNDNQASTAPFSTPAPDTFAPPTAVSSDAPAPAPSTTDPAPNDSIGLPDVDTIVDPVAEPVFGILGIGRPQTIPAPAPVVETATEATPAPDVTQIGAPAEPISTGTIESVVQETTEAATETTEDAQAPTDVVGDTVVDPVAEPVFGILGIGRPQTIPAPAPVVETATEATPAPDVSQFDALAEPISTSTVESVVQETTEAATETTEAATETAEDAQAPTDVVGDTIVDPVAEPVFGILGIGRPQTIPAPAPVVEAATEATPAPDVTQFSAPAEPTSTDAVESLVQETTEADTETTEAAQGPTGVAEDATPDAPIGLLNVGEIVTVDVDFLGSGNAEATSDIEATPTPAPDVSQSSAPAEPISTGTVESVVQETTEAATETTEDAQGPTDVVGDATQGAPIGLPNVGETETASVDVLDNGNAEATSTPQLTEAKPAPTPEVSQSSVPAEPTSTDPVESVEQEATEATKETTGAAQEPTPAVEDASQGTKAVIGGLLSRRSLRVEPVFNGATETIIAVNITDLTNSGSDEVVTINRTCALALILPHQEVGLAQKQDFVLVGYYMWLFALAFVAIINESTPHLVAACISSVIGVVWSVAQVLRTRTFQEQFDRFITNGACDGVQLLPNYWKQRSVVLIPSLVINCVFTLTLGGLAFKLVGRYRKSTSRIIGGEKFVGHLYKVVLVLSIVVQVTMFLMIASLALWVDELFGGVAASLSKTSGVFKGIAIVSLMLALPWFILCWIAVRKENKSLMVAFFIVTTFFIASLCGMFGSDAFRLIFSDWPFFRSLIIASLCGLIISLGLSIWCRMRFGRGLASQLAVNAKAEDEVMPWDFSNSTEKAWQAFEQNNNNLQEQPRPMNGMLTGTTYKDIHAPRV